ncbi:uncharacterized protein [Cicer arietinum]|uniref:Uncharacterized protein LOC101493138 isoform X2 n=1 Tax=Cicer arietinum TaxID=3827 RepID=A0A1S3DXB8_CICAR|nr:uncharacterized protein LOC101493138 isoform X2 [Cicer arietinum]XP_012568121.1 uncharacterized protein LOC101493138 isoform X2 [Cicer arietinum]
MAEEKEAFYVVKKGNVVGIYKSFSDIQPLLSSSVSGEGVSVYKGYSLPQKTEEYLVSHGLKGATYSISAAHVNAGSFGQLVACPYQDPYSSDGGTVMANSSSKNLQGAMQVDASKGVGSSSFSTNFQRNHILNGLQAEFSTNTCLSCTLYFDGASKGNPGPSGAGAILRAEDGKVYRLREGVGIQTNNVAEYRALILGLKQAIKKGYKHIHVQGDSLLVCNQIQGLWKVNNPNMGYLCNEAKLLKDKFLSFKINHIPREYNSQADIQANRAVSLQAGQVEEDCDSN